MSDEKDIFDLPAQAVPSVGNPLKQATAHAPSPQSKPKFGPMHVGAVAALATIVWIAWPFVAGSSTSDALVAAPSQTDARSIIASAAPPPPAGTPNVALNPPPVAAEPTQREIELQSRLDGLLTKLTDIELQMSKCTTPPAAEQPRDPVAKARRVANPTPRKAVEAEILKGFVVNTVYRNQAWVEKGERTYVVQTGDVIDGIRILNIDAQSRQVVTDHGLIR